jgi:thiamine-phosphate pyrophosphorylase
VVTDQALSNGVGHLEVARLVVAGGADVVQLRDKSLTSRELYELAVRMKEVVQGAGKALIVNDRLDIALAAGADGVHLGQDDLPVGAARAIAPSLVIGASIGSVDEAIRAEREGADYVAVSPVYTTPSKADAGPGRGLAMVNEVSRSVDVPVIAIGGIGRSNAAAVIDAGADGVAVISAVVSQPDMVGATRELGAIVRAAISARDRKHSGDRGHRG